MSEEIKLPTSNPPHLPSLSEHLSATNLGIGTIRWTFKTKRFEINYTQTNHLSFALLWPIPRDSEWPICAAVSVRNRKTRQQLVRELVVDRYLDAFFLRLRKAGKLEGPNQ